MEYQVVNRSIVFQDQINLELIYERQGYVRDEDLTKIGENDAAEWVCGVLIIKNGSSYCFDARIIHLERSNIGENASASIGDISPSSQEFVATQLANDLGLCKQFLTSKKRKVYQNKQLLSDEQLCKIFDGSEAFDLYNSAIVNLHVGHRCYYWGGFVAGAGLVGQISWLVDREWSVATGLATAGVLLGGVTLGVGAYFCHLGHDKLAKAVKIYNHNLNSNYYAPELSFGITPSGVGLCLKF
jgi:hypothetical protein